MNSKNSKWIYLSVLALIWGSSFILIKKGLLGLSPIQVGALRIVFAATFLLIIGFKNLYVIPASKWKYITLTAIVGSFIPAFLFAIAQQHISSTVSSIINSLTPLNTLIFGILFFKITFKPTQILGVAIGLLGCCILILNGKSNTVEQHNFYAILIIIASICYAINVNLVKKHLSDLAPLTITVGNFAILIIPAILILINTNFIEIIQLKSVQNATFFILILGVIGTGIANVLFFKLIQLSSPVFATSVTYLIPIVAFFWGFFDNESLTNIQFLGAFIVLIGVYLSAKK